MGRLAETLRERVGPRVLFGLAGLWFLSTVVFETPTTQFAATLAGSAIAGGANLLADAYDLRSGVRTVGLGLAALFGAGLLVSVAESTAVPAALAVAGSWLTMDGVQSIRHAGLDAPPEEPPDGEEVYRQYLARRIRRLLREEDRSRPELRAAFDAADATVDAVLSDLRERNLVAVQAGGYRATAPGRPGTRGGIANTLARSARRLARPVTVEFRPGVAYGDGDEADPGGSPDSSRGNHGERSGDERDRGHSERDATERTE